MKALASEATTAGHASHVSAELAAWREALALLPPGSEQYTRIQSRVDALSATLIETGATPTIASSAAVASDGHASTADPARADGNRKITAGGAAAAIALFVWKFKAIALVVLTKGKLLLLGLTNTTTVLSMLPALGLYWAAYGWRFAAGLVASIYIHEMGHVAALRRFGIEASAPMFIPGVGAVIRSRFQRTNPREEARVGLGGPIWGLGAAVASFAVYSVTRSSIWLAIGQFGAWVNLFNLIPVWQLDGAHAFKAIRRRERWLATAAIAMLFVWTREGLLVLLAVLSGMQAMREEPRAQDGDTMIAAQYVGLVAVLSWLSRIASPVVSP